MGEIRIFAWLELKDRPFDQVVKNQKKGKSNDAYRRKQKKESMMPLEFVFEIGKKAYRGCLETQRSELGE